MYSNRQIGADNEGKVPLASSQVVRSSSLSGRAKSIKNLGYF